ncbi:hypothetical protein KJ903_04100 [Patescibacteria group bacterium]|nr:hypothetical protein [Patescibacteria group bacterium]
MSELEQSREMLAEECLECTAANSIADTLLNEGKKPGDRDGSCGLGAAICAHNLNYANGARTEWQANSVNVWMLHAAARGESKQGIEERQARFCDSLNYDEIPEARSAFKHAICVARSPKGEFWLMDPTFCQFLNDQGEIGTAKKKTGENIKTNNTIRTLHERGYIKLTPKNLASFLKATATTEFNVDLGHLPNISDIVKNTPAIAETYEPEELTVQ